jgi:cell division protein FtsB
MIALLLSAFTNPARVAAGAVLAALLALSGYLKLELVAGEHAYSALQKVSAEKDAKIGTLTAAVAADAVAFENLKALAKSADAAAAVAQGKAARVAASTNAALAQLRAAPVPQDCAGAHTWAKQQAAELAKGWTK